MIDIKLLYDNAKKEPKFSELFLELYKIFSEKQLRSSLEDLYCGEPFVSIDSILWLIISNKNNISKRIYEILNTIYDEFSSLDTDFPLMNSPENMEKLEKLVDPSL